MIAAGLLALLSFCLLHLPGLRLDADGWAAWQGAASLASGHGYAYFSGNPILAWPPLYAAYNALWILVLGPAGFTLLASNAFLIVVQAFLWTRLAILVTGVSEAEPSSFPLYLLAIFVGLVIPLNQVQVLSHNLAYAFLPLYLGSLWKFETEKGEGALVWLTFWGVLLLQTHSACVAFVTAAAVVVAIRQPRTMKSILLATVILIVPVGGWFAVRAAFGQLGSHYIAAGAGMIGPLEYGRDLLFGIGRSLAPERAGAPFLATLFILAIVSIVARDKRATGLRFGALFALLALAGTFALFNLSRVNTPLSSGRTTLFVVFVVVPFAYLAALRSWPRVAQGVMILMLVPQVYWAVLPLTSRSMMRGASWVQLHEQYQRTGNWQEIIAAGFPDDSLVPADAYISRAYPVGPPVQTDKGLLIAPASYEEPAGGRQPTGKDRL